MSELTTEQMKEYVKKAWVFVRLDSTRSIPTFWPIVGDCYIEGAPYRTEPEAWAAAYAFTKQREQEIADVKEEIEYIESDIRYYGRIFDGGVTSPAAERNAINNRTITRLQGILAELKRGWKGGK